MAAALAVSIREIIMAICRRNIAMIATLSPFIVNYIAIIAIIGIIVMIATIATIANIAVIAIIATIATIGIIAIIGTIAIIAYSPERPFRSRHSTETAPETVRLHILVRCFGDAEASLTRAGCSLKSGPTGARRARSRP